jgi:cytochrome c peroxidase
LALGGAALMFAGCSKDIDGFSPEEWDRVKLIEPLATAMPANVYDDREDDDGVARLGQELFYEKDFSEAITVAGPSGNVGDVGKVGCVTCHDATYFTDSRPYSQSHGRNWLAHNTPPMVNLGWNKVALWTGSLDSLMQHGASAFGAAATTLAQAHFLYKKYRDEYNGLFPDSPLDPSLDPMAADAKRFPPTVSAKANAAPDGLFEKMAPEDQWKMHRMRANLGKVFEAHPRKLTTPDSPFALYISGKDRSEASFGMHAKNGLKLFIGKASCIDCHNGPLLSDGEFHNVGVPTSLLPVPGTTTPPLPDRGRIASLTGVIVNPRVQLRVNALLRSRAQDKGEALIEGKFSKDEVPLFSGAGQFSADSDTGLQKIVDMEAKLCLPGELKVDTDATEATCKALFRKPNPAATPPDAGDPRYAVCLEANMDQPICARLQPDATGNMVVTTKFDPTLEGAFRTPQLLNIAKTGPYFHTGEYKTLRDVVWHYNMGGATPGTFAGTKSSRLRPLLLSDAEVDDLVAFLGTLTGKAPDPKWTCNPLIGPPTSATGPQNGCGPAGAGTGGAGGGSAGGGGKGGAAGSAGGSTGNGGGTSAGGGQGGSASGTGGAPSTGGAGGLGGSWSGGLGGEGGAT